MAVTDADRAEARRLIELDERGRDIEAVAMVLAIRRQSDASADELKAIDRGCLDEIAERLGGGSESPFDGPEHIS